MEKMDGNQKLSITVQDKAYFHSDTHINLESTDVKEILAKVIHTILEKISIYQQNGSGWYFKEVLHLEIHTVVHIPMRGPSYIPLPDWIMRKKAIVNIRNTDEKCFLWCVLRHIHPREKNDIRFQTLSNMKINLILEELTFQLNSETFQNLNHLIHHYQE